MNKAVGYCRLSASDGGNSIPSQISRVENYCKQNNLQLMQVFVDDGKTGWNFDRQGFIDMQQFCKVNKDVQYLIVPHFDRFSRADPVDAMMKERYLREKLGVKILQVSEPIDTDTTTGTYQIVRFMQAFAANEERNRIVERTRGGMRYSLSQGRYCSSAPIGYLNVRDANNKPILALDEKKAPIVKMVFKEFLQGSGMEEARRKAKAAGLKIDGNSAIRRILSNPVYAGMVRVPAYKNQPEKLVKGIHPGLITESQYWQITEKLSGKKSNSQSRNEVPLRGVLHCSCGRKMTAGPSRGKSGKMYWYYFCETHRKVNLSAIKIHAQFFELLESMSISDEQFDYLRGKITDSINEVLANRGGDLMRTRHQLTKIKNQIEATEEKYLLQPDINPETYKKVVTKLKTEESRLIDSLNSLEQDTNIYWERLDLVLKALKNIRFAWENMSLNRKHDFIRLVFEGNLTYTNGSYTTPKINPLFSHNKLIIKEKGLLIIEQPSEENANNPYCPPGGSFLEQIAQIAAVLVA